MTSRNETYKLIAKALSDILPETDEVQIGQDHNKLFLRLNNQVFGIVVEEKPQFDRLPYEEAVDAARNFMATLPFPYARVE